MEILHPLPRYVLGVGEAKLAILLRKKPSKTTAEAEWILLELKDRIVSLLELSSFEKLNLIRSNLFQELHKLTADLNEETDCTRTSLLPITFYYPMPSLERILTRTSFTNSGFPLGPILLQNHLPLASPTGLDNIKSRFSRAS